MPRETRPPTLANWMSPFALMGFLLILFSLHKQVAQRATIAHLSPMCQGKILFKKTTKKKWKHHFPHYKSMGVFLRRSRAANSVVGGPIWLKFELIHNIMHVLVTSKFEKDRININRDYVKTSIF